MVQKGVKNGPKMVQKWSKNGSKMVQNGPKIVKKWSKNGLNIVHKWSKVVEIVQKWSKLVQKCFRGETQKKTCFIFRIYGTLTRAKTPVFLKFIKEGGGSNPFIKILPQIWYVAKAFWQHGIWMKRDFWGINGAHNFIIKTGEGGGSKAIYKLYKKHRHRRNVTRHHFFD